MGSKPATSWIEVLDLASRQVTRVVQTQRPLLVDVPRWSPDGNELVVGVHQMDLDGFETGAAIAVVPATGGELHFLTTFDTFAFYPDWSWATNTIVYDMETIVDQKSPGSDDDTSNLFVIQPDGSGRKQVTDVAQGKKDHPADLDSRRHLRSSLTSQISGLASVSSSTTGNVQEFSGCCVSHPRLRPTP